MKTKFNVLSTPTFEKSFKSIVKHDKKLLERFRRGLNILKLDPYNINQNNDIKKLTNISKGEGQWRIRIGDYRLRYDINEKDVVLHLFSHRKNSYR